MILFIHLSYIILLVLTLGRPRLPHRILASTDLQADIDHDYLVPRLTQIIINNEPWECTHTFQSKTAWLHGQGDDCDRHEARHYPLAP
jgi:hypothetical protein